MRKLAPMIAMTSIVALAGAAYATTNDTGTSTDKMGSPTVSKNTTNPQGMSYSDKDTMSPGTNAKMDGKAKANAPVKADTGNATTALTEDSLQEPAPVTKKKVKKAKVASNTRASSGTMAGTNSIPSSNPPVSPTSPAAANSTTGQSPGGASQ
jgi:hypothetical protein